MDIYGWVYLSLPMFYLYMSGISSIFTILNFMITIHRKYPRLLLEYYHSGLYINHIALFVLALFITTLLNITILNGYFSILLYFICLGYSILSIYFYDKFIYIICLLYKLRWSFFISGLFLILLILNSSDYSFLVENINTETSGNNVGSSKGAASTEGPSTGGPSPGGPSPGGGGGGGPETLAVKGAGLPKSDTSNTLDSTVSYTEEDLEISGGADMVNMRNIVNAKDLSEEDKNTKILAEYAKKVTELREAQMQIARLKNSEVVKVVIG